MPPTPRSTSRTRAGSTAGQLADIVVLSRDVLTAPPAAADDVQVQTTIFGGAVVYTRPR